MILQSLVDYYEILAAVGEISKPGYYIAKVSYALNISTEGELLGVIPMKVPVQRGKKMDEEPKDLKMPVKQRNSSDLTPNFLCDDLAFTLGILKKGDIKQQLRAKKAFKAYRVFHLKLLSELNCAESKSLCLFLNKWETQNKNLSIDLADSLQNMADKENVVFFVESIGFLHESHQILSRWEEYYNSIGCEKRGICLVTGKEDYIARVHPKFNVKGGTNPALICFDEESVSYCSYGKDKTQGENASVGKYGAFAYGAALKQLLYSETNRIFLGTKKSKNNLETEDDLFEKDVSGTTVVFWAKTDKPVYELLVKQLFDVDFDASECLEVYRDDLKTTMSIKSVLQKVKLGNPVAALEDLDKNVRFFVLGLSPNKGRLSVRFFWENTIETIVNRLAKHYNDLEIERQNEWEKNKIPIRVILAQTIPKNANNRSPSPILEGAMITQSVYIIA
jgi:CRISPR-associated protein Csd1